MNDHNKSRDESDLYDESVVEESNLSPDKTGVDDLNADQRTQLFPGRRKSLAARYSLRQRKRQAIITSSIVIVALASLLIGYMPARNFIGKQWMPGQSVPTPAGTLLSGPDLFYFQALPSWGSFTLDQHPVVHAPILSDEPPVRLPLGEHLLQWHAEPFQPLQCTLDVPIRIAQQNGQMCVTRPMGRNTFTLEANLIAFPVSPSLKMLLEKPREALVQATQNYLNTLQSSEVVQPGESYLYNSKTPASTATKPLSATLRFLLDTDTTGPTRCTGPQLGPACSVGGNDCRLFCTITWPSREPSPLAYGWHVAVIIRPTWKYSAQDSHTGEQTSTQEVKGDQIFTTLRITWGQGKWQVAAHPQGESPFDDPNCIAAVGTIISNQAYQYREKAQQYISWNFYSGVNRAEGCVATATFYNTILSGNLPPRHVDAYILRRFGVTIAVNTTAHQNWPDLPVASKSQQRLVLAITEHAAFIS